MNALILAAGYATRLYPLTRDCPKPLLRIGGRPIIDYLLDDLETLPDLTHIYVVTNHRFIGPFEAWAARYEGSKRLVVLDDGSETPEDRLGAIGDIAWAIQEAGLCQRLLVAASDNLLPFWLRDLVRFADARGADCITCYRTGDRERLRRTGIIARGDDGRVLRFEEKPSHPWSDLAVPPVYLYMPHTLPLFEQYLREGRDPDSPGRFVPWLLERRAVFAYLFPGEPQDIGTPESYAAACRLAERGGAIRRSEPAS